jgi:sensor histidine kinase YesM
LRESFADIYHLISYMSISIDLNRLKFYIWVGVAYFLLWLIIDTANSSASFLPIFINSVWLAIYLTLLNFTFFEYVLPWLRKKRRYLLVTIILSIVTVWMLLMFCTVGLFAWRGIGLLLHLYTPLQTFSSIEKGMTYFAPHGIFSVFFFGLVRHAYNYSKLKQASQQLLIEKQQAELNYLKSQTNPHFLFNTLNNIYSLARDKSDLAPESILRLSKLLRFMLYETSGDYIAIEQELRIINDYIALEKLRYDESLRINYNYDVEDMKQAVPPLILVPLVENAFKHGVSETRGLPFVDIHLSVKQRQLSFIVKNSTEATLAETGIKENIGLSNLRRQLELQYKEYHLSVKYQDSMFIATLNINLASHV